MVEIFISYKERISKNEFFVYNEIGKTLYYGYAKSIISYRLGRIELYDKSDNLICSFKQKNVIMKILSFVPVMNIFFECPYEYYKGNNLVGKMESGDGYSEMKIEDDAYKIRYHSGCKMSIWINDLQVASISRTKPMMSETHRLKVIFSKEIEIGLAALLSIYYLAFEEADMSNVVYTYVPFDRYNDKDWTAKED